MGRPRYGRPFSFQYPAPTSVGVGVWNQTNLDHQPVGDATDTNLEVGDAPLHLIPLVFGPVTLFDDAPCNNGNSLDIRLKCLKLFQKSAYCLSRHVCTILAPKLMGK